MIVSLCILEPISHDNTVTVDKANAANNNNNNSHVLSLSTDRIVRIQRTSDWKEEVGYESRSCDNRCIDYIGLKGSSYFICAGGERSNLLQVINWKQIQLADQLDLNYAILKIAKMEKENKNDYQILEENKGQNYSRADNSQQENILNDKTIILAATTHSIDIIQVVINISVNATTRSTSTFKHTQLLNRIHTIPFQYKMNNSFNIQAFNQIINGDNSQFSSSINHKNNNNNNNNDQLSSEYGRISNIIGRSISNGIVIVISINNRVILKLQNLDLFIQKVQSIQHQANWLSTICEGSLNINSLVKYLWINSNVFVSIHEDGTIVQWKGDNCQQLRRIKLNNMINSESLNKMKQDNNMIEQQSQSIQINSKIGVLAFADRIGFIEMDSLKELESIANGIIQAKTITAIAYLEQSNSIIAAIVKDNNNQDINHSNTTLVMIPLPSRLKSFFTTQDTQNQNSNKNIKSQQDVCELGMNPTGQGLLKQDFNQQPHNILTKTEGALDIYKIPIKNNPNQQITLNYKQQYNTQLERRKINIYEMNNNNPYKMIQSLNNSKDKINNNRYTNNNKQIITQSNNNNPINLPNHNKYDLNNSQLLKIPKQLNIVNTLPNVLSSSLPDIYQQRYQYRPQFLKQALPTRQPQGHIYNNIRGDDQIEIKRQDKQDDDSFHRTRLISKDDPLRKQLFLEPNSASPVIDDTNLIKQTWLFSQNNNNNNNNSNIVQQNQDICVANSTSILFPSQLVKTTWRQQQYDKLQQLSSQQTKISGQSYLEASKLSYYKQNRSNSSNAYYGIDKGSNDSKIDSKGQSSQKGIESKNERTCDVTEFKLSSEVKDKDKEEDKRKNDLYEKEERDARRYELLPGMIRSQRKEYINNSRNKNNQDSLEGNDSSQLKQVEVQSKQYSTLNSDILSSNKQREHKSIQSISRPFTAGGIRGGEIYSQVSRSVDLNSLLQLSYHNNIAGQNRSDMQKQLSSQNAQERIQEIVKEKRNLSHNSNQQYQDQIDQQKNTQVGRIIISDDKIKSSDLNNHDLSQQQHQVPIKQSMNDIINQDLSISEFQSDSKETSFQPLQQHTLNNNNYSSIKKSRSQNSSNTKIRQINSKSQLKNNTKQYDFEDVLRRVDIDSSDKRQLFGSSHSKKQIQQDLEIFKKDQQKNTIDTNRTSSNSKNKYISRSNSSNGKINILEQQYQLIDRSNTKTQGIQEEKNQQNSILVALSRNAQVLTKRVMTLEDESMRFRAEIADIKRVNEQFQKELRSYSLLNMRRMQNERDIKDGSDGDDRRYFQKNRQFVDQNELKQKNKIDYDSSSNIKKRPQSSNREDYSNKKSFRYSTTKIDNRDSSISVVQNSSSEKSSGKRSNGKNIQSSFEDNLIEWNMLREKIIEKLEGFKEKRRKEEGQKKNKNNQQQRQSASVGILQNRGIFEGGNYQQRVESAKKKGQGNSKSNSINNQMQQNISSIDMITNKKDESINKKKKNNKQQQDIEQIQQQLNYDEMNKRYYTSPLKWNKKEINSQLRQSSGELNGQLLLDQQNLLTTELSMLVYTDETGEKSGNNKVNRSYSGNNNNNIHKTLNSSVSKSNKSRLIYEQQSSDQQQISNFNIGRDNHKQQISQGWQQQQNTTTNPSVIGSTSIITQQSLPMKFGDCLDEIKVISQDKIDMRKGQLINKGKTLK